MTRDLEPAVRDAWHVLCRSADLAPGAATRLRLLSRDVEVARNAAGTVSARLLDGEAVATREAYGHVFACLGTPAAPLFDIAEFAEDDRRLATCGAVRVRASGLRLVENFLDMAHFPFVHTDLLGVEERPEVPRYDIEIRRDVDEVWATNCRFWQPRAAASSAEGQMSEYLYRVAGPFAVMLYKTCPADPSRFDVIGLLIRPAEPDLSYAYAFVLVLDEASSETAIVHFQQTIFLQDRIVLENQRPRLLPLAPNAETPTRADMSSVAYRRWLKEKGVRYGTVEGLAGHGEAEGVP
ncbi:aromatic ring-hydroxylating oxygenase subunit alpha [Salinarimonas ramus]|uniref:(2Fe-2S)-binding protein n=1 Tax=Salinarimonas ramus TaxID=690164 RepID=A0A917Q6J5_9HYPH|nr:aromatic ring-hydroxylating dioxygenase subunit alpha [Salinarimonas ramus]GGK30509.1 (2Fe-2S)-binding protein [Salinarimonas ramus]